MEKFGLWLVIFFVFGVELSVKAELKSEDKIKKLNFTATYDLRGFNFEPYLNARRRAALPEIPVLAVLEPRDIDAFKSQVSGYPGAFKLFAFPLGYNTDVSLIDRYRAQEEASIRGENREEVRIANRNRPTRIGGYPDTDAEQLLGGLIDMIDRNSSKHRNQTIESAPVASPAVSPLVSPLIPILQDELAIAFSGSNKFRVIVPTREQAAEFFINSSIGINGTRFIEVSMNGREWDSFALGLLGTAHSYHFRRLNEIFNAIQFIGYKQSEVLLIVVTNIYISQGPKIVSAGYGVGLTKANFYQRTRLGGYNRLNISNQDLILDAVRKSVQNAIDHLTLTEY